MKRRILITGADGILGSELKRRAPGDAELIAWPRAALDVTDRGAVLRGVLQERPDVVVHCAAMTAVDDCETQPDRAYAVNGIGARYVAEACAAADAWLVHLSTDYVFDGEKETAYIENDPTGPLSVYGQSKLWGEQAVRAVAPRHAILRTQWVFGRAGRNFVDTMLELAEAGRDLKVVNDQHGCPTYAGHLAAAIYRIIAADPGPGTYHLSAGGEASWFEFAKEIFRLAGLTPTLRPCGTAEFPRPARRPRRGVLRNYHLELTMGDPMPPWQEGLKEYLGERSAKGGSG